jgi:hypothetical protein
MGLSGLQRRVARAFFALPEAEGFALAGGAALLALELVERTTRDLDLFSPGERAARPAAAALQRVLEAEGLACRRVRDQPTFVRMLVDDAEETTEVDICWDSQWRPSVETPVGPARSAEELAVDKVLALYGRAQPRDFVDVYRLQQRYGIETMMDWAFEKDRGFRHYRLAETLGAFVRLRRQDFEIDDQGFDALAEFYAELRAELIRRTVDGEA